MPDSPWWPSTRLRLPLLVGGQISPASLGGAHLYFICPRSQDLESGVAAPAQLGTAMHYRALIPASTPIRLGYGLDTGNTPPGVTITLGLYPVTIAAGAVLLGALIPGTDFAFAGVGASAMVEHDEGIVVTPALDQSYCIGYTVSAPVAANVIGRGFITPVR